MRIIVGISEKLPACYTAPLAARKSFLHKTERIAPPRAVRGSPGDGLHDSPRGIRRGREPRGSSIRWASPILSRLKRNVSQVDDPSPLFIDDGGTFRNRENPGIGAFAIELVGPARSMRVESE